MRQFVAACCCAIVGLEVLIAVPLITCLVMFAMYEGAATPQVAMQVHADAPSFTIPSPYMPAPPLSPAGFEGPTIGPPPVCPAPPACTVPSACPAPTVGPLPDTFATSSPPVSPEIAAMAEARERVGSPLAGTSLEGNPAATRVDSIAALERVAAQDAPTAEPTTTEPPADSPAPAGLVATLKPSAAPNGVGNQPIQGSLVESLRAAADQLYVKAQSLEADGNFSRADQIRTLAREIRGEIDQLHRESSPTAPTPSTVTAASFNPQQPAGSAVVEAVNPLDLTAPDLLEPATYTAPIELPLAAPAAEKDSENPAP